MTAKWEQALQQISTEERTPDNFLSQIKKFVAKLIADVPEQLTGSAAIKQQIDHQQQAQKAAEVFLETPQALASGDVAKMSPPLVFSASLRTTNGTFKGLSPQATASQLA